MPREIKVKVRPGGSVEADFRGFAGDDCLEEAERLAGVLARFGLEVDPVRARKKTPAEIEAETGVEEEERDRVPTRE
ncbi:MAG TPA: hypothetical protein DHW14_05080 [Clostridiales bacterium]|nr:hypothetical protein [Clostridiales bacterium]